MTKNTVREMRLALYQPTPEERTVTLLAIAVVFHSNNPDIDSKELPFKAKEFVNNINEIAVIDRVELVLYIKKLYNYYHSIHTLKDTLLGDTLSVSDSYGVFGISKYISKPVIAAVDNHIELYKHTVAVVSAAYTAVS